MLKAILYYILLIAEFVIPIFIGSCALGIYMALSADKELLTDKTTFMNDASYFIMGVSLLSMLLVWVTFYKAKFSKFTLGKVLPSAKWKAMLLCSLPLLGLSLAYYAAMNLLHISFLPKEITDLGYIKFLPYSIVGSFFSAYVFYGAIQEELIRCGKKRWVQFLTLCLMTFPASVLTVTNGGDISWEHLGILGIISTCYGFWMYEKTRSTILLFVICFVANLAPSTIDSTPLAIALMVIGIGITVYGSLCLRKKLPEMIEKDEN